MRGYRKTFFIAAILLLFLIVGCSTENIAGEASKTSSPEVKTEMNSMELRYDEEQLHLD